MPQRTINLLAALFGLAAVAAIVIMGYDIQLAARTGPRWKRRLVGAGLALLAAFGQISCSKGDDPPLTDTATDVATDNLQDSSHWKRLLTIWKDAEDVASGKQGPYPFNKAGKKRMLNVLEKAGADIEALASAGLLCEAEAGLLKLDLARLTRGVQAKRPTEMRMATCYNPMSFVPARDSMEHLSARLPLLEKLATTDRLNPQVMEKVLVTIDKDVATLGKPENLKKLPEADRPKGEKMRKAAVAHIEKIRAKLLTRE